MKLAKAPHASIDSQFAHLRTLIQTAESQSQTTSIEIYLATVTPELADELLQFEFENNRVISPHAVKLYSQKMQNDQWKISSPITFSEKGELIDGQHRLQAVTKSGQAVDFLVVLGAPEESAQNIDRGRRRTVTHMSHIAGFKWVTDKHAATARFMLAHIILVNGKPRYQISRIESEELVATLEKYHEGIKFAVDLIGGQGEMSLSTVASVVAKAYYICPDQHDRLKEFVFCLKKGTTIRGTQDNAALLLANKIRSFKKSVPGNRWNGGTHWSIDLQSDCIRVTQTALQNFLKGVEPKKLLLAPKDLFPLPKSLAR